MHTRRDRVTRTGTCRWHERGVFQTLLGIKDTVGIQIQAAAPSPPPPQFITYVSFYPSNRIVLAASQSLTETNA